MESRLWRKIIVAFKQEKTLSFFPIENFCKSNNIKANGSEITKMFLRKQIINMNNYEIKDKYMSCAELKE